MLIEYLKAKYIGQYIREDGPESHQSKKGTPTMGGVAILGGVIISSVLVLLFAQIFSWEILLLLIAIIGFSFLGFYDDFQKVAKKHNKGVTGWTKLAVQGLLSIALLLYVINIEHDTTLSIFGFSKINIGYLLIPFGILVVVGASNAINLTDGLDGLASGTSAVSFFTLALFLINTGNLPLAIIAASIGGGCLGFLMLNKHPAKIFMGDSGSLMLGGAFGALGILGRLELWLIPIGFLFVLEALSVILQVVSFKTTGKRIFKMSPLHHHFELSGYKETSVVTMFTIIQVTCCIISIVAGYLWLF